MVLPVINSLERTFMDFSFSVLGGKVVSDIISDNYLEAFEVIKRTYVEHHLGCTVNPNSYFLRYPTNPRNRIIALPAHLLKENISGIKWISSFPENVQRGFPRASSVVILNDGETGYPYACLEGSIISATRTAMSAVLGAECLIKDKKSQNLAIIGNGLIAKHILDCFARRGWCFRHIMLYDLDATSSEKLASYIESKYQCQISIHSKLSSIIAQSALFLLATTASEPYLNDLSWLLYKPIVLNISLRDISPELIVQSYNIVDDKIHVLNADTSPHLTQKKYLTDDFINATIAELILHEKNPPKDESVIYSPMGMGILDLAMAHYVYQIAHKRGLLVDIKNFFYEIER